MISLQEIPYIHRIYMEIPWKYRGNTAVEIPWKYRENTVEIRPWKYGNTVKIPYIHRIYTVYIYGSGQPLSFAQASLSATAWRACSQTSWMPIWTERLFPSPWWQRLMAWEGRQKMDTSTQALSTTPPIYVGQRATLAPGAVMLLYSFTKVWMRSDCAVFYIKLLHALTFLQL